MQYSLKGHFHNGQGAHDTAYTMVHSFHIRACHIAFSSTVRQQSFQGIDASLIVNPLLKSIKGNLYPRRRCGHIDKKSYKKARKYLKQNYPEISG